MPQSPFSRSQIRLITSADESTSTLSLESLAQKMTAVRVNGRPLSLRISLASPHLSLSDNRLSVSLAISCYFTFAIIYDTALCLRVFWILPLYVQFLLAFAEGTFLCHHRGDLNTRRSLPSGDILQILPPTIGQHKCYLCCRLSCIRSSPRIRPYFHEQVEQSKFDLLLNEPSSWILNF